jgi:hypothetical protein
VRGARRIPAGLGAFGDEVAAADAIVIPPDVAPGGVVASGCPGRSSRMLAVAATSTLTAMPDPLVSESMPRPPPQASPGRRRHS